MKTTYVCSNCAYQSLKWLGRCPSCQSWNTFEEKQVQEKTTTKTVSSFTNAFDATLIDSGKLSPTSLEDIYTQFSSNPELEQNFGQILGFANSYLADFWNKGILADSLTLLAGEPGLGKSTFALQILRDLIKANPSLNALYISAEESLYQLASRAHRLEIPAQIEVLNSNNLEKIIEIIASKIQNYLFEIKQSTNKSAPQFILILDSVQTIYSQQATGSPGSVAQVTFIVNQLLNLTKTAGVAVILIGHVTKTGDIAGPKTLEHMVDSVLLLEQPQNSSKYRTLSFTKHRFGSTDKILFLEMSESGLSVIKNPSLLLLENLETGVGVAYSLALDHEQPLLVEIQALVHHNGNAFGKRESSGMSQTKLNILIAILEKYLQLDLKSFDVYTQILGLPKGLQDDNLDLAVVLAIISSLKNLPLDQLIKVKDPQNTKEKTPKNKPKKSIFCGRLTLSGTVRSATNQKSRNLAANTLGFSYNTGLEDIKDIKDMTKLIN